MSEVRAHYPRQFLLIVVEESGKVAVLVGVGGGEAAGLGGRSLGAAVAMVAGTGTISPPAPRVSSASISSTKTGWV